MSVEDEDLSLLQKKDSARENYSGDSFVNNSQVISQHTAQFNQSQLDNPTMKAGLQNGLNVETRASENLFGPQKNGVDLDEIQEVARAAEDTQNPNRHPGGSV